MVLHATMWPKEKNHHPASTISHLHGHHTGPRHHDHLPWLLHSFLIGLLASPHSCQPSHQRELLNLSLCHSEDNKKAKKAHPGAYKALHNPPPHDLFNLISYSLSAHFALAMLVPLLFCGYVDLAPTPGPLHLLVHLPGLLFLQLLTWLTPSTLS